MTRRIVRTALQLGIASCIVFILVVFLDNRFSVLPPALHNHLPVHHDGWVITDITVQECSRINVFSSCRLNPDEWHRIDKDLYLNTEWFDAAYIHVKRKREADLKQGDRVVTGVRVSKVNPAESEDVKSGEKWERRKAGIWVLLSTKRHESDSNRAVTAVDVLYGTDAVEARLGWTSQRRPLRLENEGTSLEAHITVRSGAAKKAEKPVLKIRKDGKFKIMQAADLHLSTGVGECRDTEPKKGSDHCDADTRTLDFVRRMLDVEQPDLVVLTGDQVNGETAPDVQSVLYKYAHVFQDKRVPFAAIFGNHDDQGPLARSDSMSLLERLPYSLSEFGSTAISGVGNYILEVQGPASHNSALTLYLLDTHGLSPDPKHEGYAWLKTDQIQWFRDQFAALREAHRHYAKIHMDLAFIHIPLPEYAGKDLRRVGSYREAVSAPTFNSGFRDALVEEGVKVVSAGHDHVNDFCALERSKAKGQKGPGRGVAGRPALWMCYGGGAGFGGYGGHGGYVRRMRFFEIDTNAARISTWKRLEEGEVEKKVDLQVIVDGGHVVE